MFVDGSGTNGESGFSGKAGVAAGSDPVGGPGLVGGSRLERGVGWVDRSGSVVDPRFF